MNVRYPLCYSCGLLLAGLAASATAFAGSINFAGGVVEPSRPVAIGPDRRAVGDDVWHSGVRDESLAEAQDQLASPLLDYFSGYAEDGARLITAEHR
jgi:hypothetical protein